MEEAAEISMRIEEILTKIQEVKNRKISQPVHSTRPAASPIRHVFNPSSPPFRPTAELDHSAQSNQNHGIRLPKLSLVKFNGNITKFQSFWQSFNVAVHENDNLSGIHKLNYLINSLEGPAYKAVEGLEIREENY